MADVILLRPNYELLYHSNSNSTTHEGKKMKKIILQNLQTLMKARGLSVGDLCNKMGRNKYALNSYFYGAKNFGDKMLSNIADALEVDVESLMDTPKPDINHHDCIEWKEKYLELLEKYTALLEGRNQGEARPRKGKKVG